MHLFRVVVPKNTKEISFLSWVLLVLYSTALSAAGFEDIEQKIREHVLSNGMKFIILERHDAPGFFRTYSCQCRQQ